jgi:L-ascorbate 6-phosphate lactonase
MDPADATECDAVLATHEHVDHLYPPSYVPLLDLGADLYAPEETLARPSYDGDLGIPIPQRRPVSEGISFEVGDLSVAVRGANDPDSIHPVSYVIEHDGRVFFHGGDSRPCEAFADVGTSFDVDLGALAFGSVGMVRFNGATSAERTKWYMGEDELVAAADQLRLDRLLPTHWNMWKGMEADPTAIRSHTGSFQYPAVIEVGRTGDRFTLDEPGVVPPSYIE